MVRCLLLQLICLIYVTVENEIIIITDVENEISSLYVDNFDTRVYCTMNEEPIELNNICTYASNTNEFIPVPVKPFTWNYLQSQSNRKTDWFGWQWGNKTIYLYVYTSHRDVTLQININQNITFKAQILNPFQWYDLTIASIANASEIQLLNSTSHCLDTLPYTKIEKIGIISDKLIFWKLGLDHITIVTKQNSLITSIYSNRSVRFWQYNYCENNYSLFRGEDEIPLIKKSNWYISPPVNGTLRLYGYCNCDQSAISTAYNCPYTDYAIYTFKYDPERNISCMVNEKNVVIKLTTSSNYTKDITSIASSIKGNYICTKSSCYCKDGYEGDNCNSTCKKFRWGKNCGKTCGKCLNMKDCDKMNGECEHCQEGYINSKCKDFIDIEYDVYSKNEKAAWIRWKIKNEAKYDVFLNTGGQQRQVNTDKKCDLWSNYTNYVCSFIELTKPNKYNIVKFEIKIEKKTYVIKSVNVNAMEEPSEPPLDLRQQDKKIIWNHPLITNGQIRHFLIKVTVIKSGFLEKKSVLKWMKIDKQRREYGIQYDLVKTISEFNKSNEDEVIQLAPATEYSITVKVLNLKLGNESIPLKITTELTTPITMNETYDCGKEFEVTNLVRDSDVYLVKTMTTKKKIKSNLPKSVRNVFTLENKDFSNYYHKIDGTGLLKYKGNESRKLTVECVKRKNDTYFTVVIINHFNEKETHLLINIDRVWVSDESTSSGIIISVVLVVLIAVGIGIGVYLRNRFNYSKSNVLVFFRKNSSYLGIRFGGSTNNNVLLEASIPIKKLKKYIQQCFEKTEEFYGLFVKVPKSYEFSMDCGTDNKLKNRYKNILPYDYNRVILSPSDCDDGNYINASYIDGYKCEKKYIATQGPKENTIYDFWRMVIQENVKCIVMLANLIENDKKKCEQYWPSRGSVDFEDITVTLINHQVFTNYHHRKIEISQHQLVLTVDHFQFTGWPDHGSIHNIFSYISFLKIITAMSSDSPIVTHCSAGVGRTGTVILTDFAIKMVEAGEKVSFIDILRILRKQRLNLVDNIDQFLFCHVSVYEFFNYKDFSVPVGEHFSSLIENQHLQINNVMEYLCRLEWLDRLFCYDHSDEVAAENNAKNRVEHILPGKFRLYINTYPSENVHSDYINAVSVDCYGDESKFICTQQPLSNTEGDFWRLVDQYEIKTIISLNEFNDSETSVWPASGEVRSPVDFLTITLSSTQDNDDLILHALELNNIPQRTSRTISVFHLKNWFYPDLTPTNPKSIVKLWDNTYLDQNILVVCRDGCTASAVFLAAAFVMEQIKTENVCNIATAIRMIRKSRVEFISSEVQISFIYQVAKEFVDNLQIYSNFRDGCIASGLFLAAAFVMEQVKVDSVCDIVQIIRTIRRSSVEFISFKKQLTFIYKMAKQFVEDSPTYFTAQ